MKKALLTALCAIVWCGVFSQTNLKGTIKSESGEALLGANVILKNSLRGTRSDSEGNFSIENIREKEIILQVSYLGFQDYTDTLQNSGGVIEVQINMSPDLFIADELVVTATRVSEDAPVSHTNLSREQIDEMNVGRDVPYIINQTPSVVATSDAGAGVGYTGLRIRGIDQTNINVTINGIALNDAEGQGVFWVNLPDFSSSLSDVQIQRGVGTSTNGAGAFGGTINMQTENLKTTPYGELGLAAGSFNTSKVMARFGTGLINNRWSFDGRVSQIQSDGYIDRASSDLLGYYLSGGFHTANTSVKLVGFGGREVTYQAWYGVDQATLETNRTFNAAGAIYDDNFNVVDYYDNQVDNYGQDHLQLLINQKISPRLRLNLAGHYTYGRGYFENFNQSADLLEFGIIPVNGDSASDLIDRQWLDNNYYGLTYNFNYQHDKWQFDLGGAASRYDGDHFGQVIWARNAPSADIRDEYYRNKGIKDDANVYFKAKWSANSKLSLFADVQYRIINYKVFGIDDNEGFLDFVDRLNFFNPKAGVNYQLNSENQIFYSVAWANREPNRNDYINAPNNEAKPERLLDQELGHRWRWKENFIQSNVYLMYYQDQLVLTGEINDVGAALRSNVGESYRAGIEVSADLLVYSRLRWRPNVTFSQNRNLDYKQQDVSGAIQSENTPLAYSPDYVLNNAFVWNFMDRMALTLNSFFIGSQFLDNSGQDYAKLDAYMVHDARLTYSPQVKSLKKISFFFNAHNILDSKYSSNGYMWGTTPYFFPQAGINFMGGVNASF